MIDFTLSPQQAEVRANAAAFATHVLKNGRSVYMEQPNDGWSRFLSTKPIFEQATQLGILKSLVPAPLGGTGGTLVESALVTEELFAVEPSIALNILTVNLGLMPLLFVQGKEDLQKEILAPFLTGTGAPLATLLSSEPTGSANFMEKGGKGLQTTAKKEGDDWIVNGDKVWAGNTAGWDGKGGDVLMILCRDVGITSDNPEDAAMLIIATREFLDKSAGSFQVVSHKVTPGFTACAGPHVRFTNLRIPEKFVVAKGSGAAQLCAMAFTATGPMVCAMGVGIMRAAFDQALKFAKSRNQGGSVAILERQSVADLLIGIQMKIDTARFLSWKAAHAIDSGAPGAAVICNEAKIYGSECCVQAIAEAMRVVGISSYSMEFPFVQLMEDALCLPIFDGGNQGIRRRNIQKLMLQDDYDPLACTFGLVESQTNGSKH